MEPDLDSDGSRSCDAVLVRCLLSHKCNDESHSLGSKIQAIFVGYDIELLIDPFEPGVDVSARIQTLELDALLFLSSPDSIASQACREEIDAARFRFLPVFVVRLDGHVDREMRERIFVNAPALDPAELRDALQRLAKTIGVCGRLQRTIAVLATEKSPETTRDAAQRLAEEEDLAAVAGLLPKLADVYPKVVDPTARFWIAAAVARTRTPEAEESLHSFLSFEQHPYPIRGIEDGLAVVRPFRMAHATEAPQQG